MIKNIDIHRILGHSDKTMLYRYCKETIESYAEPERRGLSKGDPIVFSFKKNVACVFLAVTNLQLKILAERSGLSNYSIRTWNTQEAFKVEKEKKCLRFIDFIKKQIQENLVEDDFRDRYLYSDCVMKVLPHVINFGEASSTLPSLTASGTGETVTKEAIISEIDRYMHLISKGVLSNREREKLRNLLSMVKSYINPL
jgi:hypothetical protein